jgi:hypothetical protein
MAGTGNTVERQCGTDLTPLPAGTLQLCPWWCKMLLGL